MLGNNKEVKTQNDPIQCQMFKVAGRGQLYFIFFWYSSKREEFQAGLARLRLLVLQYLIF